MENNSLLEQCKVYLEGLQQDDWTILNPVLLIPRIGMYLIIIKFIVLNVFIFVI